MIVTIACGIVAVIWWLSKIDAKAEKEKQEQLDREWEEKKLGAPRGDSGLPTGYYTPKNLRSEGYSEKEIEFLMHNFGDNNATD